jgi:hypothetical protein
MVAGVDPMPAAVATQLQPTPLHLAPVGTQSVELDCDGGRLSSEAGMILLTDIDDQLGLTRALAAVLSDPRDGRRIHVTPEAWLKQRGLQIAAGYEDANNANPRRDDPICKRMLDRLPETGAPLASQPTLSRFAHHLSRTALSRMARVLLAPCIASYASPPSGIVRDVDDTEDSVQGEQDQARDDSYYGGDGFMPLHRYEGLSGRLLTTVLTAKRCTGTQMLAVLKRLAKHLRHAWPAPLVSFRGDRHFASPEVMPWIAEQPALHYVPGGTSKAVWQKRAREVVAPAKRA